MIHAIEYSRRIRSARVANAAVAGTFLMMVSTSGAFAADTAANDAVALEEVIVTGSRIARRDLVSPSPIVTITNEDLVNSGQVNVEQSLGQLPQFKPGQGQSTNPLFGGGRATMNLRGLGEQRNLVLLDGRRLPGSAANNAVDINLLPQIIIGSVETISGGASAVYGSDAMSGVINFKTRSNYEGVMIDAQAGASERGEPSNYDVGALAGTKFAEGRGHVLVAANYTDRGLLTGQDRCSFYCGGGTPSGIFSVSRATNSAANPFSAAAINGVFANYGIAPGTVSSASSQSFGINPNNSLFAVIGGQNLSSGLQPTYGLRGSQVFQLTGPDNYIVVPQQRYSLFGKAEYELAPIASAYLQTIFTRSDVDTAVGYPIAFNTANVVPVTNPFIPADLRTLMASRPNPNAPLVISRRFTDLGLRIFDEDFKTYQIVAGLRGDLGSHDLKYDVYYSHGQTDITETMDNSVLSTRLNQLYNATDGGASLCTGGYNPFGVNAVSESCRNFIAVKTVNEQSIKQNVVEANLTGSLFPLAGDAVRFSLTGSYRSDGFGSTPDCRSRLVGNTDPECAGIAPADVTGNVPTPKFPFASIKVKELAAELLIPIWTDKLNATLGGRLSDYNLFGTTKTYKGELDFRPVQMVLLRGGYERAVRAANFSEALAPPSTASGQIGLPSQGVVGDPCGVTSSARTGANAAQVRALCQTMIPGALPAVLDNYIQAVSAVQATQLGNPNLAPEEANTYTLGAVFTPQFDSAFLDKLSLSVDYYSIDISGAISTVSATQTLNKCFNIDGSNPTYDPGNVFCQQISRNQTDASIVNINLPYLNLGAIKTSGIDGTIAWQAALGRGNYFGIDSNINYLREFKAQALPGGAFANYTGTIADSLSGTGFANVPQPRWKALTSATYRNDTFSLGLRWRYSSSLKDGSFVSNPATTVPGMSAYHLFDLVGSLKATEKVSLRAGVNNLFDHSPVVVGGTAGQTLPSYYDVIGRYYYAGARVEF